MNKDIACIHAKLRSYNRLLDNTKRFIEDSLKRLHEENLKAYVACSFGKDSSVMLHLILSFMPDIPVRFATHPETNLLDNYKDVVDWWLTHHQINYTEVYCDGGLIKVKHAQRKALEEGDFDAFFVGIRAQESVSRRIYLKKHGQFYRLKFNGRIKICPLAWWTEHDVAAYLYTNDLPLLGKYIDEGISARTTSGIPRTHIRESLTSLKNRDIQRWNALVKLFPDAAAYV